VDSNPASSTGIAELDKARSRERAGYMRMRSLSAVTTAFVLIASFRSVPAPGLHGTSLVVTAVLIAFCAATVCAFQFELATLTRFAVLLVVVGTAAWLIDLQANRAAFVGVIPALAVAAFVLPIRLAVVLVVAAISAVSGAWLAVGGTPILGIALNDFAIVGFFLLSMLARRLRESNEVAQSLLAELEQTRAAQAEAAVLAERQRLARDVHDVLAHSLSGLLLNLESARLIARQSTADAQVGDAIDRAHRLAKTGLAEARRAIGMLRGDALPGPERLDDLAAEFEADSGVPCTVAVTGAERELGSNARLTFYRVAQEALSNVRKHASPERVEIRLDYAASAARLVVEDYRRNAQLAAPGIATADGTAASNGAGYGLTGMKERAELLGGTLTTGHTRTGYRVDLRVPL
jgi:signal transduction histidine kinase